MSIGTKQKPAIEASDWLIEYHGKILPLTFRSDRDALEAMLQLTDCEREARALPPISRVRLNVFALNKIVNGDA